MATTSPLNHIPFDVTKKQEETVTSAERLKKRELRPKKQYVPALVSPPKTPISGGDSPISISSLVLNDQFFGNIHNCTMSQLLPKAPAYMSTHLRTIAKHFTDPSCYIVTDVSLARDATYLAYLPPSYPWLFTIEVYLDTAVESPTKVKIEAQGLQLLSTRAFFRDLEGEIGERPYVEITKEESLAALKEAFEEEKARTGLWVCKAECPWGHFEHWGRQYVVRFLKQKVMDPDQSPIFGDTDVNWADMLPVP